MPLRVLDRRDARELHHAALRRAVRALILHAEVRGDGRRVHDRAAAAGDQVRHRVLDPEPHCLQVDRDDAIEHFF
jgi:hypothetical protein